MPSDREYFQRRLRRSRSLDRLARRARFAARSAALQAALADWLHLAEPGDMEIADAVEGACEMLREILNAHPCEEPEQE